MSMLFCILLWWLIGAVSCFARFFLCDFWWNGMRSCHFKVKDLMLCFLTGLVGPVITVFLVLCVLEERNFWNKILIRRKY